MALPPTIANLKYEVLCLRQEVDDVKARVAILEMRTELVDRVSVLEDRTCAHESRLEDLETWQEKADDKLEAS